MFYTFKKCGEHSAASFSLKRQGRQPWATKIKLTAEQQQKREAGYIVSLCRLSRAATEQRPLLAGQPPPPASPRRWGSGSRHHWSSLYRRMSHWCLQLQAYSWVHRSDGLWRGPPAASRCGYSVQCSMERINRLLMGRHASPCWGPGWDQGPPLESTDVQRPDADGSREYTPPSREPSTPRRPARRSPTLVKCCRCLPPLPAQHVWTACLACGGLLRKDGHHALPALPRGLGRHRQSPKFQPIHVHYK